MKKELLLKIARAAIVSRLEKKEIDKEKLIEQYPELAEQGAVFVTLTLDDALRGCIGSLVAHRSLLEDLIHNAKAAAFEDPRFLPLSQEEYLKIKVEVSILSKPKELIYRDGADLKNRLEPNVDGVILTHGSHRATFLPQVWEQLPKFDLFMAHLCQKAGLKAEGCLEAHPKIEIYQVEKIEEPVHVKRREMSVAGSFYPASCKAVEASMAKMNEAEKEPISRQFKPTAMIVPHAGYLYSGDTANRAYKLLEKSDYERVVVIGPSHRVAFKGASVGLYDTYETPCGDLPMDIHYSQKLMEKYDFSVFDDALHHEHSTETQIPFIKQYLPDVEVVEIVYGDVDYQTLALLIKDLMQEPKNLLVISSDLSHFYTLKEANRRDKNCIEGIKNLNLNTSDHQCEACGLIGIQALLSVAKRSQVIDYRTSFDASADDKSVVGYLSALLR